MVGPTTRSRARDDTETPEPAHRHESFSVFVNVEDAPQERRITRKDFDEWIGKNPDEFFGMICRRGASHVEDKKELQQRTQNLEDQVSALQDRNIEIQENADNLQAQLDANKARILDVETERNEFARLVARAAASARQTPATSAEATQKKSSKVTDPAQLNDGKDPRFEDWMMLMKNKLRANADHFHTPELRIAYVVGRCTGDALKHVSPRMRDGATSKYFDADDIFEHLDSVYGDPNRVVNAKRRYHSLMMKPNDKFHSFLSEFLYLADEAGVNVDDRKEDLYNELTTELQKLVINEADREDGTFTEFTSHCSRTANRLEVIQNRQRGGRFGRCTTSPSTSFGSSKQTGSSSTPTIKREETNSAQRATSIQERRCFVCQEPGHIVRDCPKRKSTTELKIMEQEEQKDEDSENAST